MTRDIYDLDTLIDESYASHLQGLSHAVLIARALLAFPVESVIYGTSPCTPERRSTASCR